MRRSRAFALALVLGLLAAACDDGSGPNVPVAPNPVVDLAVEALTDSSVALTWTAPLVDGKGATRYQIFYSSATATPDSIWATVVYAPAQPALPGTAEHYTVQHLLPLRTYSFALRSDNGHSGWAEYSNTVAATIPWSVSGPGDLIDKLEEVYRRRDYDGYSTLFSTAADSAPFYFYLSAPVGANWDATEELRIHHRMFEPQNLEPGESPVPPDLWLSAIEIQLEPVTPWTERTDVYRSVSNPTGLDPARWRATEARYQAFVFLATQGETDYQVNGRQNFVVIEDLRLAAGAERKFLLYRWEDLGSLIAVRAGVEPSNWSSLKALYAY